MPLVRYRPKKGNSVGSALTRPGLIVVDGALSVIAYNAEALHILTFPDAPDKIRHVDTYLSNKIRTDLTNRQSPPKFSDCFRSAKRTYVCRSFPLDLKGHQSNGSGSSGGLLIVILERKSNGSTKLTELSERFGLTVREQETVQHLLQGLTSKEIAQRMSISPNTVKAFLRLVMVKMNVSTRSGIVGRIVGPTA
jgi:DNA-binding CsgD family transcriptional regulator